LKLQSCPTVDELRGELAASGRNAAVRNSRAEFALLLVSSHCDLGSPYATDKELISAAPRLLVRKTIVDEKSILRLSPNVKVPLSRIPGADSRASPMPFNFIEQHEADFELFCVMLIQDFFRQRAAFRDVPGIPEASRSLGDLVTVLNSGKSIFITARDS